MDTFAKSETLHLEFGEPCYFLALEFIRFLWTKTHGNKKQHTHIEALVYRFTQYAINTPSGPCPPMHAPHAQRAAGDPEGRSFSQVLEQNPRNPRNGQGGVDSVVGASDRLTSPFRFGSEDTKPSTCSCRVERGKNRGRAGDPHSVGIGSLSLIKLVD